MKSAGLLPYRLGEAVQVLVAHPGGPFWAKKDEGAWSIVKGLIEDDEDPAAAAAREFLEETGWEPPPPPWLALGTVQLKSGKVVTGWAAAADYDPTRLDPGTFIVELRGKRVEFPEIDRVEWMEIPEARRKLNPVYGKFLDELERLLGDLG